MNKFKKCLDFIMKWFTIIWNMIAVFCCGVFGLYSIFDATNSYYYDKEIIEFLVMIVMTIVINGINFLNRAYLRQK